MENANTLSRVGTETRIGDRLTVLGCFVGDANALVCLGKRLTRDSQPYLDEADVAWCERQPYETA